MLDCTRETINSNYVLFEEGAYASTHPAIVTRRDEEQQRLLQGQLFQLYTFN